MIPQEVADLADALVAEFGHELTHEAVSKANRIVDYMRRQGWAFVTEEQARAAG